LAAWGYSSWNTWLPDALIGGRAHVYFEAAAVIVTLVLTGRFFEARAKGRTGDAIRALAGLQVRSALVINASGEEERAIEDVKRGDVLLARPGDRIAVDGVIVTGDSHVDQSMLNGEPLPLPVSPGSRVRAGTVNVDGSFTYRAEGVGADTVLAHIIRMVDRAQSSKLPVQAVIDRVTLWFVPAVMALAALTFAGWLWIGGMPGAGDALAAAISVLIVACPCAMGLATPTSIITGTGRGAGMGILFRRGDALQTLAGVNMVAFDKTGTLTLGKPVVTSITTAPGVARRELLALLAGLESRSEHPLARAIVEAAALEGVQPGDVGAFRAKVGLGAEGIVNGRRVIAGSLRLMADEGVELAELQPVAERALNDGATLVIAAIDGREAAIIEIADATKPTAKAAIERLAKLGVSAVLISGDNEQTARKVGEALGINDIVAGVLPAGKAETVAKLKASGRTIAFAGDGINDAPALAAADAGIAMGNGTEVAIEAADVVLAAGDPERVADAIALSRATMRNIRQNLFWAFGYNILLIPLAMGLFTPWTGWQLSPMVSGAAMALSSVFVLSNALRLRHVAL
jgi:heavy metal translocating P-type ATPase